MNRGYGVYTAGIGDAVYSQKINTFRNCTGGDQTQKPVNTGIYRYLAHNSLRKYGGFRGYSAVRLGRGVPHAHGAMSPVPGFLRS